MKCESDLLAKLSLLDDMQSALLLLRYCSVLKITHHLRSVPLSLISEAAELHDTMVIMAFQNNFACGSPNALESSQLKPDIQQEGFDLRSAKHSTFEAFLGGWSNTVGHLPHRDGRLSSLCDNLVRVNGKEEPQVLSELSSALASFHQSFDDTWNLLSCTSKLPDAPNKLRAKLHQAKNAVELNQVLQQCTNSDDQARIKVVVVQTLGLGWMQYGVRIISLSAMPTLSMSATR